MKKKTVYMKAQPTLTHMLLSRALCAHVSQRQAQRRSFDGIDREGLVVRISFEEAF